MKNSVLSIKKKFPKSCSSLLIFKEKSPLSKNISQDNFFTHKTFIEMHLKLIKECQTSHLSYFPSEKDNKKISKYQKILSVNSTKNNLIGLKNRLLLIQAEKNKELVKHKNEKDKKNKKLCDLKKFNEIQKNIEQLKNINFQYENEIKKFENLIELRNKSLYLVKSYDCFLEMFEERFCLSTKNFEDIEKIYKDKYEDTINNLIYIRNEIFEVEEKIKDIKTEINSLKNTIKEKENYILDIDIINEDPKEYNISGSNEKVYKIKHPIKKKVNFKLNINNNKLNNYKYCKYNNKCNEKIMIYKNKNARKRLSYPDIKLIPYRKMDSCSFLKDKKRNSINYIYHNKTISDYDRTTISSFNEKTIESENIYNNTF